VQAVADRPRRGAAGFQEIGGEFGFSSIRNVRYTLTVGERQQLEILRLIWLEQGHDL